MCSDDSQCATGRYCVESLCVSDCSVDYQCGLEIFTCSGWSTVSTRCRFRVFCYFVSWSAGLNCMKEWLSSWLQYHPSQLVRQFNTTQFMFVEQRCRRRCFNNTDCEGFQFCDAETLVCRTHLGQPCGTSIDCGWELTCSSEGVCSTISHEGQNCRDTSECGEHSLALIQLLIVLLTEVTGCNEAFSPAKQKSFWIIKDLMFILPMGFTSTVVLGFTISPKLAN